jgi:hypothetical protein
VLSNDQGTRASQPSILDFGGCHRLRRGYRGQASRRSLHCVGTPFSLKLRFIYG